MVYKDVRYSPIVEAVWAAILILLCGILVVAAHATGTDVSLDLVPAVAMVM